MFLKYCLDIFYIFHLYCYVNSDIIVCYITLHFFYITNMSIIAIYEHDAQFSIEYE